MSFFASPIKHRSWPWFVWLALAAGCLHTGAKADTVSPDEVLGADSQEMSETEPSSAAPLLVIGGRIDAMLTAGLPSQQGFSIPSARLSASGDLSDHISYRLALGETREFSTVLLPLILPVDAYFDYNSRGIFNLGPDANLRWRFGLFNPSLNPWWTPDLSDLDIPDYLQIDQAMLLSRDIGTELTYEWLPSRLSLTIGAFNGNGIFGVNSNNSRAFSAMVSQRIPIGQSQLTVGASGYLLNQAEPSGSDYKSDWVGDVFANFEFLPVGFTWQIEGVFGEFQDNLTTASPVGGATSAFLDLTDSLKLFTRIEYLQHPPSGVAGALKHWQIGPDFLVDRVLRIFVFYDYLDLGNGTQVNSGQLRARLVL